MIRPLEENDISSCLEIYNWYIENSVATFEETKLSLSQFQQRVHRICEKYPYIVLEENHKIIGYAYLDAFHERTASEKIHEKFGFEKEGFLKQVGYKHETWLGVSYYVKQIKQTS